MKTILTKLTVMSAVFFCTLIQAQVGIGTTTPQGALDVSSSDSGMLVPRVSLTSVLVAAPVLNPQGGALTIGTLVYNTATAGVSPNNVVPGFYYWDGTRWVALAGGAAVAPDNAWLLTGNAGTEGTVNYIGTNDNQPLSFRTNGVNKFRIMSDNNQMIGFGGTEAAPTYSWNANRGNGMWLRGSQTLAFSTGSKSRLQIPTIEESSQIHAMDRGTETLPFYSWFSDTDIGMYSPGTNQLGFSTSGTERLRILANGNVGVGNATPRTKLEVSGALSLNEGDALMLPAGVNNNVSLGSGPFSYYRVEGVPGNFSIGGLVRATGANGQLLTIENTSPYDMTILHQATTSTAANRVLCPGAKNLVLKGQHATVTLQYNASHSRWVVVSYAGDTPQVEKPAIYSVLGSTDISLSPATYPSPGSYSDMSQMTLTFTPESSVVYLNFSASGDLDTTSLPGSNHIKFRIVNVTASNTTLGGAVSVSTDYDQDSWVGSQMVASGWSVGFNMFPVTVTPGVSTTLKIQWSAVGIYAATARNYANSEKNHSHRNLTIIDYKN